MSKLSSTPLDELSNIFGKMNISKPSSTSSTKKTLEVDLLSDIFSKISMEDYVQEYNELYNQYRKRGKGVKEAEFLADKDVHEIVSKMYIKKGQNSLNDEQLKSFEEFLEKVLDEVVVETDNDEPYVSLESLMNSF
jgi:hypothetical protein